MHAAMRAPPAAAAAPHAACGCMRAAHAALTRRRPMRTPSSGDSSFSYDLARNLTITAAQPDTSLNFNFIVDAVDIAAGIYLVMRDMSIENSRCARLVLSSRGAACRRLPLLGAAPRAAPRQPRPSLTRAAATTTTQARRRRRHRLFCGQRKHDADS